MISLVMKIWRKLSMWKWTDAENIKCIILDVDSLDENFLNYSYDQDIKDVKVYKMILGKEDEMGFDNNSEYLYYYDMAIAIQMILEIAGCESYSLIAMSNNNQFLKGMMQHHIGTVFAGEMKTDTLKYTPDFTYKAAGKLKSILTRKSSGYLAEVLASGEPYEKRSLLLCETTVNNGWDNYKLNLIFGGRYYSYGHGFILDDPLSKVVHTFKWQYVKMVDNFYESAINYILRKEAIDIICYTPLKRSDIDANRFDRFASLELNGIKEKGLELKNIITCNKDFSQKGNDYYMRKEIVHNAFEVNADVSGKNIVILDDVYSTGSTIQEISRVLYDNGANKVTAIMLAVNQLIESSSCDYHRIICPNCGKEMTLRIRKDATSLFFGCSGYAEGCHEIINCLDGLKLLKAINKLEKIDVIDFDDEY